MIGADEVVVVGVLCSVWCLEVVGKILLDDFWLAICTCIIRDKIINREGGLLHSETIHGFHDVGGMVVGEAAGHHHIFIFLYFVFHLINAFLVLNSMNVLLTLFLYIPLIASFHRVRNPQLFLI